MNNKCLNKVGAICAVFILLITPTSAFTHDDCTAPMQKEPCEAFGPANSYWYAWQFELCREEAFKAWQRCMTEAVLKGSADPNYNHTNHMHGCHAGYAVFKEVCHQRYRRHVND